MAGHQKGASCRCVLRPGCESGRRGPGGPGYVGTRNLQASGAVSGLLELAACYLLLVPAIILVAWIGGRIYSGVILSGGKPGLSMLVAAVMKPSRAS
jgi:hypothetical protein